MINILCFICFIGLSIWEISILNSSGKDWRMPYGDRNIMQLTNYEALFIVLMATAYFGFMPVLSLRLAFLEVLCLIILARCSNRLSISVPMIFYFVFLAWVIIGIFYSPSAEFGVRMLLKYLYPLLIALVAAKVVKDGELFVSSGIWARRLATIGIALHLVPGLTWIIGNFFWFHAAMCTGIISMAIFSFALVEFSDEKRKNLIWGLALCLPCILLVFRTDIFGTAVALATFFVVKYKIKAIPIVISIGILGLCTMFYIPAVKNKMFFHADKVTMADFLSGKVQDDDVRNNMRKFMWDDARESFYYGHEMIGSGTGRVQKFFYTEAMDSRRGGQLHNDFLVILCDNGNIGLALFILVYLSALVHSIKIYTRESNPYVRMSALTAGASLIGVVVTMYSDNTVSYSMATLSFPWAFYGMALGLKRSQE